MKHAEILSYYEPNTIECDMCDSKKYPIVSIDTLSGDVLVICQNCLEKIIREMKECMMI